MRDWSSDVCSSDLWQADLVWAVDSFRLSTAGVEADTQIHTHMCYSEFNDIIESIAAMDADVITIETSRSNMELLKAFEDFRYPNDIGPGVYDIHSPNVPDVDWMVGLMRKAAARLPSERLWRSEEHTSELQSLMRISYAVFCLKKKKQRHR